MTMSHAREVKDEVKLGSAASKLIALGILAGFLGLGSAVFLAVSSPEDTKRLMHAYLVSYIFFLSISLGSLFFVIIHHLTRAGWSVVIRRVAELLASVLPFLAVLSLPIIVPMILGHSELYSWVDVEMVQAHPVLHKKMPYLNVPFFLVRMVLYFGIWSLVSRYMLRNSTEQDTSGDVRANVRMQRVSPVSMILFGLSVTFAAFDLLMSLTPTWFSTIFGVYFFAGCVMGMFATLIVTTMLLQWSGRIKNSITIEHFHDLGKFMFAFVFFWGYIGFSQFMLIWYANLPEETEWYQPRMHGAWIPVSLVILFGHFVIPFLGLISRHVKRNRRALAFWAVYLLAMQWIDLYWIIMPHFDEAKPVFGIPEIACFMGLLGLYVACFGYLAKSRSLIPLKDPHLGESLAFQNF